MPQDLTNDWSTLVKVMALCCQATSHCLNQCWIYLIMPYGITRGQWINSLWPSDAIWRQRSGSTLAQVMACCLTAPSHYLNQCLLIISKVWWHSSEGNFTEDISASNHCKWLEKYSSKIPLKSPWANELRWTCQIDDLCTWLLYL